MCRFAESRHTKSTMKILLGREATFRRCAQLDAPVLPHDPSASSPQVVAKVRQRALKRYGFSALPSPVRGTTSCIYKPQLYRKSSEILATAKPEHGPRNFSPPTGFHNRGQHKPLGAQALVPAAPSSASKRVGGPKHDEAPEEFQQHQ